MIHQENMDQVRDWGELPEPDIWYHVRISKVEEKFSEHSSNAAVYLQLKVQDEPYVGRIILDNCSLQPHALMKLKAYYSATDYFPGPEGHDPERLLDRECFVRPVAKVYQGENRLEIKPHNIKPLREGRPQR